jgi:hypothetical protein
MAETVALHPYCVACLAAADHAAADVVVLTTLVTVSHVVGLEQAVGDLCAIHRAWYERVVAQLVGRPKLEVVR